MQYADVVHTTGTDSIHCYLLREHKNGPLPSFNVVSEMSKINHDIKNTDLATKSIKAVIGLSSDSDCTTMSAPTVILDY